MKPNFTFTARYGLDKVKVFAIIVSFNGQKWIQKCIASLHKSTIPLTILLIDNNSQDNTLEIARRGFLNVNIFELKNNTGFGAANNIGMRHALKNNAAFVFLLNQDAWIVEQNTVEYLISISNRYPEYGILSPLHLNRNRSKLDYMFSNNLVPSKCPDFFSDAVLGHELKKVYEVQFVNAAAWLLPRKTIETVGGFDPIFFQYGEDKNYVQRLKYHGFKVGVCPHVTICHDRDPTNRLLSKNSDPQLKINRDLIKYADIDINGQELLKRRIKKTRRKILKSLITLRAQRVKKLKMELTHLQKIHTMCKKSWENNIKKG